MIDFRSFAIIVNRIEDLLMFYILHPDIALRSWQLVPYAYYTRHNRFAKGLTEEEFSFLSRCDGATDLPETALVQSLCDRGLCRKTEQGKEKLSDWQRHMVCDNRYMPAMNWMITGKCNYNCIHCFNAADNNPLQSEFTMEEALALLDEAQKCGIHGFTITGGEPMAHRHFLDIMREIQRRGMEVFELNTNGFYLTQEVLTALLETDCKPTMKISFDGIGFHDTMRGRKGAQEDALRAISLCVENGFPVMVQMQMNRMNLGSILPSLWEMERRGVTIVRVIRTSESPRWEQNAPEQTLSFAQYYDACLSVARAYMDGGGSMDVNFWQFLDIYPAKKSFRPHSGLRPNEEFRESFPLCRGNRGMIAVCADGNVYPCMQQSGCCAANGISFGNVKSDGLQALLRHGRYMDEVCATVADLVKVNRECRECPYLAQCCGGCRALVVATGGGLRGCDRTKCYFFKEGYPQKIKEALAQYKCL